MAILVEITNKSSEYELSFDATTANRLLTACDEASDWSQAYILDSLMFFQPTDSKQAELLVERMTPRLQHSNPAVIMSLVRVMLHLINFIDSQKVIEVILGRVEAPLSTFL